MDLKEQKSYYDNLWKHEEKLNSLNLRRAIKILEFFVVPKKEFHTPKVLDLGCGEGRLTSFIGEYGQAEGIELSTVAVERANKLYPHVKFFQGDALNYAVKDNYYDVIISQEVIEHVEDQTKYLNQCSKALKKDGFLILTTPNKSVLQAIESDKAWSNQPIENVLTPKELKALLNPKFSIIKFDSIVLNFGSKGYYKLINHRIVIGVFKKLGLKTFREHVLGKIGFGLHLCVLARKK